MSQVTLYLDPETEAKMKAAAQVPTSLTSDSGHRAAVFSRIRSATQRLWETSADRSALTPEPE